MRLFIVHGVSCHKDSIRTYFSSCTLTEAKNSDEALGVHTRLETAKGHVFVNEPSVIDITNTAHTFTKDYPCAK